MPIVEYTRDFRKDISVPFYSKQIPAIEDLITDGRVKRAIHLSQDQLIQTIILTSPTIEDYATLMNVRTLEIRMDVISYYHVLNKGMFLRRPGPDRQRIIGFTKPFTLTSTYTFPQGSMYKQLFLDSINVSEYVKNSTSQITDIHTTDQDLVLVEQFKNNDDYNNYRFLDFKWIPQLCLHRAVRTVKFQT